MSVPAAGLSMEDTQSNSEVYGSAGTDGPGHISRTLDSMVATLGLVPWAHVHMWPLQRFLLMWWSPQVVPKDDMPAESKDQPWLVVGSQQAVRGHAAGTTGLGRW